MIILKRMRPLIAPIAVHSVRINHQFEMFAGLLEGVDKYESILEMYVVIPCAVS